MFFIKLFNILKGYVIISIKGLFTERFLNICSRRSINLWNVKRINKTEIRANITVEDFKKLPPVAKKSFCKIHIVKKNGTPFFVFKHRKRKAFLIGIAIFLILIYVMSRFVWVIEISGNKKVPKEDIINSLSRHNIKAGILKNKINATKIQSEIMTDIAEVSWVGLSVKGTTIFLDIRERTTLPEKFNRDEPCSLVANQNGVIVKMTITEGEKLVNVSDVVTNGQILVSGIIDGIKIPKTRFVHSDGEIKARVWHEKEFSYPQYEKIVKRTEKEKQKHSIKIFDNYLKFYLNDKVPFKNFERESHVNNLTLGNGYVMPFSFHYDKYFETKITMKKLSKEASIKQIYSAMDKEYKNSEIVSRKYTIENNTVYVTYECIENIAKKVGLENVNNRKTD